jgi:hypothetical protein
LSPLKEKRAFIVAVWKFYVVERCISIVLEVISRFPKWLIVKAPRHSVAASDQDIKRNLFDFVAAKKVCIVLQAGWQRIFYPGYSFILGW